METADLDKGEYQWEISREVSLYDLEVPKTKTDSECCNDNFQKNDMLLFDDKDEEEDEDDIDKYALYQIARYCDELVPDGKGGQEPRFTANVYLSRQEEAYKVIKDLASTFRAMLFWMDGKVTAIQDSPKEPVYTFTMGNVENGVFSYQYTGRRARVNQVNVTWNNPAEMYKKTIFTLSLIHI